MQPFFRDSSQLFQQLINAHSSYITFNELEDHLSIFLKVQLENFFKVLPTHMKVLHSSLCTS